MAADNSSCISNTLPAERHRTLDNDGTITASLLVPPSRYEKPGNTDASKNFGSISMCVLAQANMLKVTLFLQEQWKPHWMLH